MTELVAGQDFRDPALRREVFLRFYDFHLRYRSHPGAVYYLIPHLRETLGWDDEATLWYAFLNGNTQNPATSLVLHRRFPGPESWEALGEWYPEHRERLAFDTDRRYHRPHLPANAAAYASMVGSSQQRFWTARAGGGFPEMWAAAAALPTFGRLSAWSYTEYLRIAGVDVECDDLMLADREGSRSHRNGLAIVSGRDDLDWHASNPDFDGRYDAETIDELRTVGADLVSEARTRADPAWRDDVGYFTLESALCTYKSWHRPNRRYPNVYNDLLYDRLRAAARAWPDDDFGPLWDARAAALPDRLRLECSPHDPGCVPAKQNLYRETGQVPMMDEVWPCFANDLNAAIDAGLLPRRAT